MGLYFRKRKDKKFNRHHLLYPARAWREAGDDAQYIRGQFIVTLPSDLHNQLHRRLDRKLGGIITRKDLPPPRQMTKMANLIRHNSEYFHSMSSIRKLRWLSLQTKGFHNRYLNAVIKKQIAFLQKHEGEY